jgi:single-strand DNA-binding protein
MSKGYHKTIIKGNLGKDPETKHFDSGSSVCNFSVAVSDSYLNKTGEKVERTEWYNVVVWGKLAEISEKYLAKGDGVLIEGRMQTRSYEDNNGEKKYVTELNASEINMLGGNRDQDSGQKTNEHSVTRHDANVSKNDGNVSFGQEPPEDDLPF